jgi:CubicO group peptidase (beta-lactamase class C family)
MSEIHGTCDARFTPVREEFARNFAERGEIGASVCVLLEGQPVVDLWGGVADRHTGAPWQRDTIGVVWSCTKGAVALCAHLLIDRGLLELDAPVSRYWPEYATAGKEPTTLRHVLDHRAGVPVIRKPMAAGTLYDWGATVTLLAAESPWWEPGTRQGYHAVTFGHLVGEVLRRVTGQCIDAFFRDEVAGPLGLDFYLGSLPESEESRVAVTIKPFPVPRGRVPWRFLTVGLADASSIQGIMIHNTGRPVGDTDRRAAHAACLPSSGGLTNARGLAGMYATLLASGERFAASTTRADEDTTLLIPMNFALGFMKACDNRSGPPGQRDSLVIPPAAFGHAGMGGSLGFADPAARLSFGYTMNKQGQGVLLNSRGQALVDAVYVSLGVDSMSGR